MKKVKRIRKAVAVTVQVVARLKFFRTLSSQVHDESSEFANFFKERRKIFMSAYCRVIAYLDKKK